MYQYDPENPEKSKWENSPEDLQWYREIYATYMQKFVGCEREAFTGFSHIYESLEVAAGNVYALGGIAHLLCQKCIEVSRQEGLEKEGDKEDDIPMVVVDRDSWCFAARGNAVLKFM